jgi:hypothetical protein
MRRMVVPALSEEFARRWLEMTDSVVTIGV